MSAIKFIALVSGTLLAGSTTGVAHNSLKRMFLQCFMLIRQNSWSVWHSHNQASFGIMLAEKPAKRATGYSEVPSRKNYRDLPQPAFMPWITSRMRQLLPHPARHVDVTFQYPAHQHHLMQKQVNRYHQLMFET